MVVAINLINGTVYMEGERSLIYSKNMVYLSYKLKYAYSKLSLIKLCSIKNTHR